LYAAAGMLATGTVALVAVPGRPALSPSRPTVPWWERSRDSGILRPDMRVVEAASPIASGDGALVMDLGIDTAGGVFRSVIARGSRQPATGFLTLATAQADQTEMPVRILRGTSSLSAEDTPLGWFRVGPLQPGSAGRATATLIFRVAAGAISLGAMDPNGRPIPVSPTDAPAAR
jgi:hypothetical protein